jgi:hypothetical protein
MLLGQVASGLQRVSSRASDLASSELFGLPAGIDGVRAALSRVDREGVLRAVRAAGIGNPLVVLARP